MATAAGVAPRPAVAAWVRRPVAAIALLGALIVAVPAVVYAGETAPGRLDVRVEQFVDESSSARIWRVVVFLDWLGEPVGRTLLVLAVAAVCLIVGRRALALTAFLGMGLTTVLTTLLKYVVDRRIHGDFLSYPSGHTAAATAAALIVGLLLADVLAAGPVLGAALVLCCGLLGGAAMAWAQIDLTAHYPTDTLGGFGAALLTTCATALVVDRFTRTGGRPA
ncbi:phosphatase PAP2 family protein [Kribbella sp. CA-247076]|uniref:phosphatase PAP2 family protein n=1 Tax=Kribbella sp. CA-247076 TaxID=3239941 RepID=UPI003D8A0A9D